jgi:putative transcriptional regulator
MSISFRPLWISLAERGLKKGFLKETLGISTATLAKMGKDELVSLEVIQRICEEMDLPVERVIRFEKSK